jgi:hypothetical protein
MKAPSLAHVIVSYLFAETPAGDIDFGSGRRETVQFLIDKWNETTDTPNPITPPVNNDPALLIIAGAMPISATILVFVFMQRKKSSFQNEEVGILMRNRVPPDSSSMSSIDPP